MIFVKDVKIYAKVWNAELASNGKYIDLKMSTSEKDREKEGEFINSNWLARAIGHSVNSLRNITEGARIEITSFKLTNVYNKEKEKAFFNLLILEAKIVGDSSENSGPASAKPEPKPEQADNSEDPF